MSFQKNFVTDERYSEYEIRHEGSQNEINVQKISVMKDPFQLKVGELENAVKRGDSSIPVYYETQKADDLFRYVLCSFQLVASNLTIINLLLCHFFSFT